jgi:hypothetical protein
MKLYKYLIFWFIAVFLNQFCFAQENTSLPQVIPPSPEADDAGNSMYKTYEYGVGSKTLFIPQSALTAGYEAMSYQTRVLPCIGARRNGGSSIRNYAWGSYRKRIYTGNILPENSEIAADPVFYSNIKEYDGTISSHKEKTRYTFDRVGPQYVLGSLTGPSYPITNITAGLWQNLPEYSFNFSNPSMDSDPYFNSRYHISEFNLWESDTLTKTGIYKHTGGETADSDYQILKEVNNTYMDTPTDSFSGVCIVKGVEMEEEDLSSCILHLPNLPSITIFYILSI